MILSLLFQQFYDFPLLTLLGRFLKLSKIDRLLMCWWAFTGLTHIIIEGYFVFSPEFYKKKTPFYLAAVCKLLYINWHSHILWKLLSYF